MNTPTDVARQAKILLPDDEVVPSLAAYRERGGLQAWDKALQMEPAQVIAEIRAAKLRGRGGAGFPTAIKWQGVAESAAPTRYMVCNGAEGEPGTFKDRWLLRHNPYQTLEGLAIAAQVIGAERAFIGIKERFHPEAAALTRALEELRASTHVADNIDLVLGPDEYLFGEEKALLNVIDGGAPLPRVFPPYIHGLFAGAYGGPSDRENNPTVVNNVETLSHVPHILNRGADWFRTLGTEDTPGTMIFSVSGDVAREIVVELPLGLTLRQLIVDVAGGPPAGRQVKAVFPGLANAVITAEHLDTALGFDSMKATGSALGSGGYIVYDDSACMVEVAYLFARFLHIESCNQCPPCKIGSRTIMERLERLLWGTGKSQDVDEIWQATGWVENAQRCYLPTSTAVTTASIVRNFPDDFRAHLTNSCKLRHDMVLPKMTDYIPGQGFTYDLNYVRKRADWSYGPA